MPVRAGRTAALIAVIGISSSPAAAVPIDEVVRTALQTYPSIALARANTNVARFEIDRARALHYPTIDVVGAQRLAGAAVNLAQPRARLNLWAGGGIEATIEREQLRTESLATQELATREEVATATAIAYLRVVRARQLLAATRRNLERHQRLTRDFEEIVRIDAGRRYDLIQSRSRQELVQLQVADREAELASALEALARFYPHPIPLDAFALPAPMPSPVGVIGEAAIESHPQVVASRQQLQTAEANIEVAKAARRPRVDVEATAGAHRATQLVLSWPAFDLGAAAAESAAAAAVIGANAAVAENMRTIAERQRMAMREWESAGRREAIARGQIAVAEEVVEVYRAQFQIGRRNLLDLLNAYAELANAELTFEAAGVDRAIARHQIESAVGRLAEFYEQKR
ncbi:MAG TPA: TolC family protein [Burkholderiaceae bacterium]|nr:TolC family protein [Burkholderiaceae bacterium]